MDLIVIVNKVLGKRRFMTFVSINLPNKIK